MKAFLRVFLRVKKSARAQGIAEEWQSLDKEVAKYDAADSESETEDSDDEDQEEDGDEKDDGDKRATPIDIDINAARNADNNALIDQCEDSEKCTGSQLNEDIELPPLTVEERKQARVLLSKAIGLPKAVQNHPLNSEAWETKSKELNLAPLSLVKDVVSMMCSDRDLKLRQYTFSGEEWTILEQLEQILEAFILATEKISQAEVALVFEVIPLIDKFTTIFGQMIDNTSLHIAICHAANTGLIVLNKYYSFTDDSEIYQIAMILHPRYKTFYFLTVGWEQTCID
ncbi:hypothetical protein B0H14DRAFT_3644873 [Mycena olivaceomarginata]|nr:hypothetical protein B0H14DRAFT_3644873 [Mycena olivaceomarginata]